MKKKLNERGLPSVGGVPHTDTSGQLGQARRPWSLTGTTGGHSQSADSGFSSKLGRVNKGRDDDKYAYRDMFPENEEEETEEDTYDKSIRTKIWIDLRGRKPMPERKLTDDIDTLIENNEQFQAMLEDDRGTGFARGLKNFSVGVVGDFGANIMGFIPGIDLGLVAFNIKQLEGDIEEGRDILNDYTSSSAVSSLQGDFYDSANSVSDSLMINLFDLLERAISALPVAGDVAGAGLSIKNNLARARELFKVQKGGPRGAKPMVVKGAIRKAREIFSKIVDSDESNAVSQDVTFTSVVPISLDMLEEITNIIENYDAAYSKADNNYEALSDQQRQQVWTELSDADMLFTNPPGGFVPYVEPDQNQEEETDFWSLFSESKIRTLVAQILNEDSKLHDCEKEHPDQTCAEWEEDKPDFEEHSIGGYTGPMASPANPKKFYKGMLDAYPGSHYVDAMPKSKA